MKLRSFRWRGLAVGSAAALALTMAPAAFAHPDGDEHEEDGSHDGLHREDASEGLSLRDEISAAIVSDGPNAKVTKNLDVVGRGERLGTKFTTDVWALGRYAYIGTFNNPCGTGQGFVSGVGPVSLVDDVSQPGVAIFDIHNKTKPTYVGSLPSVLGSRVNDVKVSTLNSGDVLVHSNESCNSGPGGVELYDVDDPTNPVHLASVRIDEINPISNALFGGRTNVGVHNIWLFTQGERDYMSVVAGTAFDNFQTFDITDPTNPVRVSAWGAEELFDPGVGDETVDSNRVLAAVLWLLDGPGGSGNRFLHDITYDASGTKAYLSNWDAGLVLLDMSDPANPQLVSQAMDVANGSLDGELNSHAAWPSADGTIVVETEEDFNAWELLSPPGSLTFSTGTPATPLPGTAIATVAGDDFEANQVGNVGTVEGGSLTITSGPLAGNTYAAIELSGDQPRFADTGAITGDVVFIGRACNGDPILNASEIADGGIAIVRRGACTFREKNFNAEAAGADAVVIANNSRLSTPWGGVRIWDYSDPANPVLASTFDTVCSAASTPIPGCDAAGTYSVHNVQVETKGSKTYAYISWYWDGMVVLDVTDPYNPTEVARFFDNSAEFLAANGGNPHDFWGVYKQPNEPWILGSDRNGGLYVFKLKGAGSGK